MPTSEQPTSAKLNDRQRAFIDHYVVDGNATKAAIKAGYASKYGAQTGYKLLQDRRIRRRIEEKRQSLRLCGEVTPEQLVQQYRRIAMTSPTDLMIDDGSGNYRFKRPDELTDDEKPLIQDVTIQTKTIKSANGEEEVVQSFTYKLATRKEALDSLARINGMFRDKIEHEYHHRVKHLFAFIAKHPEQSETVAWLNQKHGRTIEGEAKRISHNAPDSDHDE